MQVRRTEHTLISHWPNVSHSLTAHSRASRNRQGRLYAHTRAYILIYNSELLPYDSDYVQINVTIAIDRSSQVFQHHHRTATVTIANTLPLPRIPLKTICEEIHADTGVGHVAGCRQSRLASVIVGDMWPWCTPDSKNATTGNCSFSGVVNVPLALDVESEV